MSSRASGDGRTAGISGARARDGGADRVDDLLAALMLQSAERCRDLLAEHVSGTVEAFVKDMNARVRHLGLRDSRFASPNGLDDRGYSTARDLVAITRAAYAEAGFASIVATTHERSRPRAACVARRRTATLLWLYPGAVGVKDRFHQPRGRLHRRRGRARGPPPRRRGSRCRRARRSRARRRPPRSPGSRPSAAGEVVAEGEDLGEVRSTAARSRWPPAVRSWP